MRGLRDRRAPDRKAGAEPFAAHALATFPDLDVKDLRRIRNRYWRNAFKHATTLAGLDRADEELLERFTDVVNDHTLFVGWYDYGLATGKLPIEAQVFEVWYFALSQEKLNPDFDITPYQGVFPNLASKQRTDQKNALRTAIADFRRDPIIINHVKTDGRSLHPAGGRGVTWPESATALPANITPVRR